jgi:hypothetical protein
VLALPLSATCDTITLFGEEPNPVDKTQMSVVPFGQIRLRDEPSYGYASCVTVGATEFV